MSYMTATLTFRPKDPTTLARLEQRAKRSRMPKTALADRYVEEGLDMDSYPGIVFRDGPAGRRAGVAGGPDVWQVIEVFLDESRDVSRTARYLDLRQGLVEAAVAYYADRRDEVDEWITANRQLLDDGEAAFLRRQAVKDG